MRATTTAIVTFVVLTVLLAEPCAGFTGAALLAAAVAALAVVLGAFCAPASYGRGAPLLALSGGRAWERAKSAQLVAGGVVAALARLLLDQPVGRCAGYGITAALFLSPFVGRSRGDEA